MTAPPRREPPYAWIRRNYGVTPCPGARVRHTETGRRGVILRTPPGGSHYVRVRFDGDAYASNSHPTALDYNPKDPSE